jgi:hypothetical protein
MVCSGHFSASCLVAVGSLEAGVAQVHLDRHPLVALAQSCYTIRHWNWRHGHGEEAMGQPQTLTSRVQRPDWTGPSGASATGPSSVLMVQARRWESASWHMETRYDCHTTVWPQRTSEHKVPQAEADAALERAFSHGVNHIDTADSYHDSELRLGSWIQRHGKTFFLATKTEERTAAKAREGIHRSLERLQVDALDLLQFHNLVDPREWETALGPGGAQEAAVEARQQGLVRHIGVTGHGLTVAEMHFRALDRFPFDSVLLPLNWVLAQNAGYLAGFQRLVARCQSDDVAVMTIKSIVRGPWGDDPRTRTTWYQPLEDEREIALDVSWVLGHAGIFLITASDTHLLPLVLAAAEGADQCPDEAEMQDQAARLGMTPLFVA